MADLIEINIQADVRPVNNLVSALGKASNAANLADKNMRDLERSIKRGLGGSVDSLLNVFSRLERAGMSLADVQKGLAQDARMLAQANQAQINSLLGVDRASKSARDSASAMAAAFDEQDRATRQNNASLQQAQRGYEQLRMAIDKNYASRMRVRQASQTLRQAVEAEVITMQQAVVMLRQYAQAAKNGTLASGSLRQGMSRSSVAIQQFGYQTGDFLVQIQSGTNAMVAFGQQATQLAGLLTMSMNPRIIALGAALSIIIPLATAVGAYFMRTKRDAESAAEGVDELESSLKSLDSTLREYLRTREAARQGITVEELLGLEGLEEAERNLSQARAELERTVQALSIPRGISFGRVFGEEVLNRVITRSAEYQQKLAALIVAENRLAELRQKQGEQQFRNFSEALALRQEELALLREIQQYGEDSAQVVQLRREQALAAELRSIEAQREAKEITDAQAIALSRMAIEASELAGNIESSAAATENAAIQAERLAAAIQAANAFSAGLDKSVETLEARLAEASGQQGAVLANTIRQMEAEAELNAMRARAAGEDEIAVRARLAIDRAQIERYKEMSTALDNMGSSSSGAARATEDLGKEVDNLTNVLEGPLNSAIGSFSDAWADFVVRGFRDFKGFVGSVLNSFKNMIAQMIAIAARNRIMIGLGLATGAAGSATAAGASGIGNLVFGGGGGFGNIGSGIGSLLGMGGGFTGTFGAGMAATLTGGISGAGGAIGAGLGMVGSGGGLAGTLSGLSMAAGAALPIVGAVAAAVSFFRSKTKELDTGLKITIDNMDTLVESFRTVEKSRFWGLSKKVSTSLDTVSDDVANPIIQAVSDMQTGVENAAKGIGIASVDFSNFSHELQLSLKGLTDEQASQKVQEELAKLGDTMAETALQGAVFDEYLRKLRQNLNDYFVEQLISEEEFLAERNRLNEYYEEGYRSFSLEGETALETLNRLSSSLAAANQMFYRFDMVLQEVSIAGAHTADVLIRAFGGLDNFNSAFDFFFNNFLEGQEQLDIYNRQLNDTFAALGLQVPTTIQAFRDLVFSLQATAAGVGGAAEVAANQLATIMSVAGVFKSATDLANQLRTTAPSTSRITRTSGTSRASAAAPTTDPVLEERLRLERNLLEAQGDTAAIRALELEALDASNRAIQEQIWLLEDQAVIAAERNALEEEILRLQGNTQELRNRELAALNPMNRSLQEMVWTLQDAKEALDAINEEDFATLVDFQRAIAAQNAIINSVNIPTSMGTMTDVASPEMPVAVSSGPSPRGGRREDRSSGGGEVNGLDRDTVVSLVELVKYTKRNYNLFRKWDVDGLPEERV